MFLFRSSFISVAFVVIFSIFMQCRPVSAAPAYAFNHAFEADTTIPSRDASVSASKTVDPWPKESAAALEELPPEPQAKSIAATAATPDSSPAVDVSSDKQTSGSTLNTSSSIRVSLFVGTVVAFVQLL